MYVVFNNSVTFTVVKKGFQWLLLPMMTPLLIRIRFGELVGTGVDGRHIHYFIIIDYLLLLLIIISGWAPHSCQLLSLVSGNSSLEVQRAHAMIMLSFSMAITLVAPMVGSTDSLAFKHSQ